MAAPKFEYYTYQCDGHLIDAYGWGRYDENSVLAGQPRKMFIGTSSDLEEVLAAYPGIYENHPAMEVRASVPRHPPADWSPYDAGESWGEDDY
jgi:hypothetical protein